MQRLHQYLRDGRDGLTQRRAKYNVEVLSTLSRPVDEWDPSQGLYVKQAEAKEDVWERLAHLVLAPDLALKSRKRMCKGGREAERAKIFDVFLPKMEESGWAVRVPFLRFWEGERDKDAMLRGLTDRNDIGLVSYVYDKWFAPLMDRKTLDSTLESHGATADAYFQEHCVMLTRIVQLTSQKTYQNGSMQFEGKGLEGERETVRKKWFYELEDAGYKITAKISSLWGGERDREVLLEGLDDLSKALMLRLLRLHAVEEGAVLDGKNDDECYDTVTMTAEHESQMVAYLAKLGKEKTGEPCEDLKKKQERSKLFLDAARIFSSSEKRRAVMQMAVDKIYEGETSKDVLYGGLEGVERAFIRRVLYHLDNTDIESLESTTGDNKVIRNQVLKEPPSHRFFKQQRSIFRRIAQLSSAETAKQFENERLFPGTHLYLYMRRHRIVLRVSKGKDVRCPGREL
jgi:uncharacterized protein YfcZ (UPF0381/DUF406 family)